MDFLDAIVYNAQKIADPTPLINPMIGTDAIFSSISPVARMQPISTRTNEIILSVVIFSLNVKYAIINTNTGAVLNRTAARDRGRVLIALL